MLRLKSTSKLVHSGKSPKPITITGVFMKTTLGVPIQIICPYRYVCSLKRANCNLQCEIDKLKKAQIDSGEIHVELMEDNN